MALSYIYTLIQTTASGNVEFKMVSTRKWVVQEFVKKNWIEIGWTLSGLSVVRAKDGSDVNTYIDIYEFMDVDPGEE